jgi:amino acid permease
MNVARFLFVRGALLLTGTVIGAGLFGLPILFARVGIIPGSLLFFLLGAAMLMTHLGYAKIQLEKNQRARLSGYVHTILGDHAARFVSVTYPLQIVGANIAYILLGGSFLSVLALKAGWTLPVGFWEMVFWFCGALTVFYGMKMITRLETIGTWLLLFVLLAASFLALWFGPKTGGGHASWSSFLLPFGAFLFSLSGIPVVSEVVELGQRKASVVYTSILMGTSASVLLSWIFGVSFAVAASPGSLKSPTDILQVLPPTWAWIIPLVGFLAVATSYITTAQDLRMTLHYDFSFSRTWAWMIALGAPLLIALFLAPNFLHTISFIGAIFTAINGIFVGLLLRRRFQRRHTLWWGIGTLCCGIFGLGMLSYIVHAILSV